MSVLAFAIAGLLVVDVGAVASVHPVRHTHTTPGATTTTVTKVKPFVRHRYSGAPASAFAVVSRTPYLDVYDRPSGAVKLRMPDPTVKGAPLVLLIRDSRPGWFQVALPVRPNGSTGWVKESAVHVRKVPYEITVVQHLHTATLWKGQTKVRTFPTAVGTPSTPSPNGLFFIDVIIDTHDPYGPYGPWAMGLSGFSNVYQTFGTGDAEVAFHGTEADWSVGQSASHGCFRLHNSDATWLAHTVTLGTPVYVTS